MRLRTIPQVIFVAFVFGSLGGATACSGGDNAPVHDTAAADNALTIAASSGAEQSLGVHTWGITIDEAELTWATGYDAKGNVVTRISYQASMKAGGAPTVEIGVAYPEAARGSLELSYYDDRVEGTHTFLENKRGLEFADWLQKDIAAVDLASVDETPVAGRKLTQGTNPVPGSSSPITGSSNPVSGQTQPIRHNGVCLVNRSNVGCGGKLLAAMGSCGASLLTCTVALGSGTASAGCTTLTFGACSFTIPIPLIAAGACGFSGAGCVGNVIDLNDNGCHISTSC